VDISVAFEGDYNNNQVVDAADYTVWRDSFGQIDVGNGLVADGNHNGIVDSLDYLVWRENFGKTLENSSATVVEATVPEPVTAVLLMFAAAGWRFPRGWAT
jgi:hypothetical protein